MKRDKIDKLFSLMVRERDNWTCQRCGKYYPEGSRQGLHCSHIFSRRHRSTRWEPLNAVAHCFSCHQYLGGNPVLFNDWARDYLGNETVDMLTEKHRVIIKLTEADKRDMYTFMRREYNRMIDDRVDGKQEKLTFVGYL